MPGAIHDVWCLAWRTLAHLLSSGKACTMQHGFVQHLHAATPQGCQYHMVALPFGIRANALLECDRRSTRTSTKNIVGAI
eukprot:9151359-Alexandrium_andersonii.AAC.1